MSLFRLMKAGARSLGFNSSGRAGAGAGAKHAAAITLGLLGAITGLGGACAAGQALAVQPVTLQMSPAQRATTLTVTNRGVNETAIQIRVFAWNQGDGKDDLSASDGVQVSPPLAVIPPGAKQLVRLVLRRPVEGREVAYRILLDQIPPPAVDGVVAVVLRLSIPIFVPPPNPAPSRLQFSMEKEAGQFYLVGINYGLRHEKFQDIVLSTGDGVKLKPEKSASPYLLAGATRRWAMIPEGGAPKPGEAFRLTAHGDAGAIEQQVSVASIP